MAYEWRAALQRVYVYCHVDAQLNAKISSASPCRLQNSISRLRAPGVPIEDPIARYGPRLSIGQVGEAAIIVDRDIDHNSAV
jgi:hypothetical protein